MDQFLLQNSWVFILLALWSLPWKGWALWKAARLGSKLWFIALLIINTLAVLDILYIFIFSKKGKKVEPQLKVE